MKTKLKELRHQTGQILILGFEGQELTPRLRALVSHLQPGGTILFQRNIAGAEQCHSLNSELELCARLPLFRCVDLEGGTVDRLREAIAPSPSQFEAGCSGDKKLFRRFGRLLGDLCRATGFNVDFAPVSDLGFDRSRSVLGSRTVSADAEETVVFVREFLKGLHSAGVLGCGKHFPGLGEANLDTHLDLAAIDKSWDKLWQQDLLPYRKLRDDFPFVMVAHAAYLAVTGAKMPASLSRKWMTEILKKKIGYRGIVLSDDLEMGGVLAAGSIEHAAIETLRAGADMFLVCHKEENVINAYEAILREAERDRRFAKTVATAARKVESIKSRLKGLNKLTAAPTVSDLQRLRGQIDTLRSELRAAGRAQ